MTWLSALIFASTQPTIRVGSKHFTEGYLLAEIFAQRLESSGLAVRRVHGLGGTKVCFSALQKGEIDVYPEYTGTIGQEILRSPNRLTFDQVQEQLAAIGLSMLNPLGFRNTYAVAMQRKRAHELGIARISDLAKQPALRAGLSVEFLQRHDGWPALAQAYGLSQTPSGLEHGLAYEALVAGQIDLTDAYTTDAKLSKFDLLVLADDRAFFPDYAAVPLIRSSVKQQVAPALAALSGRLDEATMQKLNAQVEIDRVPYHEVARQWLGSQGLLHKASVKAPGMAARLLARTWRHLWLTLASLLVACVVGIPLGIASFWLPVLGRWSVAAAGVLQTIPSIALLALFIPFLGIGVLPALVALFLYALLPILRNTVVGLLSVDAQYKTIAQAMGLTPGQRLRHVELPLARPVIFAGIKTAAVINIGTATLAAFIGAGGLGEPIVTGLALNDTAMILEGAIPAAGLALLFELVFRRWV